MEVLNAETSGERAGIEALIAEYESALLRYAARLVNDPTAAQDVVQDVFMKVCKHWTNGARPAPQMKAWLYRVTHNAAVDHIRRESRLKGLHERQAEEVAPAVPASQHRDMADKEAVALALDQIDRLDPREKQVVLLRLQEGLSYREIAEITRRSEGNIGNILHHALKKLAAGLRKAGVSLEVS